MINIDSCKEFLEKLKYYKQENEDLYNEYLSALNSNNRKLLHSWEEKGIKYITQLSALFYNISIGDFVVEYEIKIRMGYLEKGFLGKGTCQEFIWRNCPTIIPDSSYVNTINYIDSVLYEKNLFENIKKEINQLKEKISILEDDNIDMKFQINNLQQRLNKIVPENVYDYESMKETKKEMHREFKNVYKIFRRMLDITNAPLAVIVK